MKEKHIKNLTIRWKREKFTGGNEKSLYNIRKTHFHTQTLTMSFINSNDTEGWNEMFWKSWTWFKLAEFAIYNIKCDITVGETRYMHNAVEYKLGSHNLGFVNVAKPVWTL